MPPAVSVLPGASRLGTSTHWTIGIVIAAVLACTAPVHAQPNFDDIFLDADADAFDPGLAIGEAFPAIRALYDGQEIDNIDVFMRDKGAVFLAVRSADW